MLRVDLNPTLVAFSFMSLLEIHRYKLQGFRVLRLSCRLKGLLSQHMPQDLEAVAGTDGEVEMPRGSVLSANFVPHKMAKPFIGCEFTTWVVLFIRVPFRVLFIRVRYHIGDLGKDPNFENYPTRNSSQRYLARQGLPPAFSSWMASCEVNFCFPDRFGTFRKLGVPYSGVLILRILLFRVLHSLFCGPYNKDPTV